VEIVEWVLRHIGAFFSVVLIDLLLAGDNAVVIGLAARGVPLQYRRRAIILGSMAAIILRLLFAAVVAVLVNIPLLRAVGGALLFWIAWKLVAPEAEREHHVAEGTSVAEAVRIIVLADAVMSIDNVLALVAVSHGNLPLLAAGLMLTIPLLVWGSAWLSLFMNRMPWLVYLGGMLLVWVAVGMILHDSVVHRFLPEFIVAAETPVRIVLTLLLSGIALLALRLVQKRAPAVEEVSHR
jgi:YjbE family integral membrane protein